MLKKISLFFMAGLIILFSTRHLYADEAVYLQQTVLTLEECLKNALANNPKVIQAFSTVNLNKAARIEARSDYLPKLNTTLGLSHAQVSKVSFSGVSSNAATLGLAKKSDTLSEGTTIEQLIWDFGRTLNEMRLAKENLSFAEYALLETQEDTILRAKTAYFKVLQAQLLTGIAKENLTQANAHLLRAQGFYEVGLKQKYEVTRAEVDVSNANLEYVTARKNYELSKVTLNVIMGKAGNTAYSVQEVTAVEPRDVDLSQALESAMENRAEILKLKANVRVAERKLDIDKKGNWPKVFVSAGQVSSDTNVTGIGSVNSWNAGVALKWPWFDGFRNSSKIKQTEENLKIAKSSVEELTFNIAFEVQDAALGLGEAKERIQFTDKTLQQANENFQIQEARYKEGLSSSIESDDARILLISAKSNRIAALCDYLIALAKYERSTGMIKEYAQKGVGFSNGPERNK